MKNIYQYLLIISLWMVFFAYPLFAEDIYVTGITNITMRTGPGLEHKIIAMLETGTKLEIVEFQKDWSRVRKDLGETGWVLTRFLTKKVPDALVVEKLKKNNQNLMSRLKAVEEENKTLTVKNVTLIQIEEKYNKLKQESTEFLKLDAKYKKMTQQFEVQKSHIETLENNLNDDEKLWFLSGAGVFIVGLFLGLSTRKKKRSSLL
ncbi:TIGR04211 family SH3 domain-containing protein [Desulfobacula sp.]|uniref:TIGR04211 family SH3 domain-containing protein n=1 Tax=Desulfobacula sp. TaxID=2593537 RepID=UPI0025B8B666|nr:TIGR04211 family SH3 domain-containing protein [Desulfobacula sp.]MBC2703384.1 TIGR04211 family SH3 domain-containing protein [Desulfobacula sp.]